MRDNPRMSGVLSVSFRKVTCFFAIGLSVLMSGCVTGQLAPKALDSQAKKFVVPPGKSAIYVYRDNSAFGAGVLTKVTLDNSIGVIGPANFLVRVVDPGKHVVFLEKSGVSTPIPARATFEVKVNQKIFILTWTEFANFTTNRVRYEFVPPETAEKNLVSFELVEWID